MENLNDVEFGSDKDGEEAPILVAQRYLNIFRQVHIFNKAKRDQFDDELLSLPQNITDFFKRMPGGRLLVEHIEDVKTERGISFVKTNKDEFSNPATDEASSTPVSGGGTTVVGGSLVIDESFAESLAKSMALAFQQNPMQATVSGGSSISPSGDFGKAFELIAEEIKNSRASLLDVLRETRNITDTVIASQVSISRILEGILSARSRDDSDVADLNNRIIASQTSITKLLESIYTDNSRKTNVSLADTDIEQRLQSFKLEIKNEINNSLEMMQRLLLEFSKNVANSNVIIQKMPTNDESQIKDNSYNVKNYNEVSTDTNTQSDEFISNTANIDNTENTLKKKKKKKKKNKNNNLIIGIPSLNQDGNDSEFEFGEDVSDTSLADDNETEFANTDENINNEQIDGIIKNESHKYINNFENVDLSTPPLEFDNINYDDDIDLSFDDNEIESDVVSEISEDDFDVINKEEDFAKDEKFDNVTLDDFSATDNTLDTINVDDEAALDDFSEFESNEEVITDNNETSDIADLDNFENLSLDDFSTTDNTLDTINVDDNVALDDFSEFESNEEVITDNNETSDIADLDNFENLSLDDFSTTDNTLDTINVDDNVALDDFSEFESNEEVITDNNETSDIADLDNFENLSLDDFSTTDNTLDTINVDDNVALDDFSEFENSDENNRITSDLEYAPPSMKDDILSFDTFANGGFDEYKEENISAVDDINFDENIENNNVSIEQYEDNISLDNLIDENVVTSQDDINEDEDENRYDNESDSNISLDSLIDENINYEEGMEHSSEDVINDDVELDSLETNDIDAVDKNNYQSRYSAEMDKIRQALTSDNIDISTMDTPIALDEYSDDENISDENNDDWEWEYVEDTTIADDNNQQVQIENIANSDSDDEWEYEYVDEEGNPIENTDDNQDWEWEYVEEEDNENTNDDNNKQ